MRSTACVAEGMRSVPVCKGRACKEVQGSVHTDLFQVVAEATVGHLVARPSDGLAQVHLDELEAGDLAQHLVASAFN